MTLKEMEAAVAAWVNTPEGMKSLEETCRRARAAAAEVLADAKVTPEQMRAPVTI